MKNPAAVLTDFGPPSQISVVDGPVPTLDPGQLLVRMLQAPINPADLNVIEGKYGQLPKLPAVVGNEGVGRVEGLGAEVEGWKEGDLLIPMCRGTWCRYLCVEARMAIPLPPEIPLSQAAMLTVNPATALLLLEHLAPLRPGEWVMQNAANSGVGRCVIQIARLLGLRTINLVRRPELLAELTALGADGVLLEEEDVKLRVRELCGKERPRLGLNAVGGSSALSVANSLADGGQLVTFGGMSKQPLKVPIGQLIFRDLRYVGFWLTRWLARASPNEARELYTKLAQWVVDGKLLQPVDQIFPLAELSSALAAAATDKRPGKILLEL